MGRKAVLFDCDGVLINTEEIGYHVLSAMLRREGINYSRAEYVELLSGVTYKQFMQNLRRDYAARNGYELHPDFEEEMNTRFRQAEETQMQVIEGIKALLQKLRAHNIPFAVCSNSGAENLIYKLKKAGLFEDFVPYIYSRDHVENSKPAPDMYLQAARIFGADPKDCLVVEDSITGTMAGVAAGMNVIGFIGEAHRDDCEADMLQLAGAKMIALGADDLWDHIARFNGLSPQAPSLDPRR